MDYNFVFTLTAWR